MDDGSTLSVRFGRYCIEWCGRTGRCTAAAAAVNDDDDEDESISCQKMNKASHIHTCTYQNKTEKLSGHFVREENPKQ